MTGQPEAARAADRTHYIAAEEVEWDYAPAGYDQMMGQAFTEDQTIFVENGNGQMGRIYRKVIYREYTDESFNALKPRRPEWEHLGLLGPVIHAEVGDTIRVVFHNNASRSNTVHPHGVFYDKANEGTPYADGTAGDDKLDDGVPPGGDYTYVWEVPRARRARAWRPEFGGLALSRPCGRAARHQFGPRRRHRRDRCG